MITNDKCMWCGKTYEDHEVTRRDEEPVPMVPCLGLRSGFKLKYDGVLEDFKIDYTYKDIRYLFSLSVWDNASQKNIIDDSFNTNTVNMIIEQLVKIIIRLKDYDKHQN